MSIATRPDIRAPGAIDAPWLTAVLQAGGVDAVVKSFSARPIGAGQIGDSFRFTLHYERGGETAPASLVGKFPAAGEESRQTGVALGNYLREVRFYQRLAPTALVLHPGPIIRGLEITAGVADGPQSAILDQVHHGVAIRMAVMERALTAKAQGGRA